MRVIKEHKTNEISSEGKLNFSKIEAEDNRTYLDSQGDTQKNKSNVCERMCIKTSFGSRNGRTGGGGGKEQHRKLDSVP